jgi:hypothetical protein
MALIRHLAALINSAARRPIWREQVDPALEIFPFSNSIGVTNSGHIAILHELVLSQQWLLQFSPQAALALVPRSCISHANAMPEAPPC